MRGARVHGFGEGEIAVTVYPPAVELAAWIASSHTCVEMNALGTCMLVRRRAVDWLVLLPYRLYDARESIGVEANQRFGAAAIRSLTESIWYSPSVSL